MSATPVTIRDYDPAWPGRFEALVAGIRGAIGDRIPSLEHIGSTSIPGCAAKPIVDILGGVRLLADAEAAQAGLESIGYEYVSKYENVMPYRRYFVQPDVHLHVVETTHGFWKRHLAFRDWLRAHDADRDAYVALKRELAARFPDDPGTYTDEKTDFIQSIERHALSGDEPAPAR